MKTKVKRLLSSFLVAFLILGMFQTTTVNAVPLEKEETAIANGDYEIYPKPHEVNYLGSEFVIRKDVNVVYDSKIDAPTKKRMTEVLNSKGKNITVSNEVVKGKTNILVGIYNSGEYGSNYIKEKYNVSDDLFNKRDSYYLTANNGEIAILGKDTDAAFYGITTLKHIFNQMEGSTIRKIEIKDYADTGIRGFIEGYYGIPWSNEDRMSLMKFGGEFKMTSYIFAPKDDLYHTRKWRELYPEDQLAEIAKMVQVGIDSKTRFVWTAHPFMGGFNGNDYRNEMTKLIAKFEQLYSVGVRQFGILGDDVGNLDKKIVVDMMTELSEWGKEKGDVYDFVFCPAGYNDGWQGDYSELNLYDKDFPEDVQIFWTGNSVCAPINQDTLTKFKTKRAENGKVRRSPLFWLNWPVNDINMSRLMLGKGSLLHSDINAEDLAGAVTNPMQDAEPSKVAIFAVADFTWNVNNFNDEQSWKDSFKYVDKDAGEALYEIAKHTSDPAPNGHGLVLGESEEINPLLEEFKNKLNGGQPILESGKKIIAEMDKTIKASEDFIKLSKNERMVEQITPFANSLKDLASGIKSYVQATMDLKNSDNEGAIQNFADGTTFYSNSKKHDRITISGTKKAEPGSKRLIPFIENVRNAISDEINELVNGGNKLTFTAETNINGIHEGKISNIIDGKDNTFIWNNQYEAVGQYYQVNLSKPTTVYGVNILNGNPSKPEDTFGMARVEYKTADGNWTPMNNKTYGEYAVKVKITGVEIPNVTAVRYICTETKSGRKWPAMREFRVLTTPEAEAPTFTSEVIRTTDGWRLHQGTDANAIDKNPDTSVHYNVRQGGNPGDTTIAGDYFGVRLSEEITLGKIKILQGPNGSSNDYFKNATLEYSLDGSSYTEIKQCVNERDITIDLSNRNIRARYVRLRNNANQNNWIGFREFEVNAKINHNGKVYTNVDDYKNYPADYLFDNAVMVPASDVTLQNGQYIGLKLDRIHELTGVTVNGTGLENLTLQVGENEHEWTSVESGNVSGNGRYIRLVNLTNSPVTLTLDQFKVTTREFKKSSLIETNMGTVADGKIENLFDKDRTTGVKYQGAQTKGHYMILDLGQEIDLNELKIVVHDSDKDYLRDGKVYASANKSEWGEAIITIGDQAPNTSSDDSTIGQSFPHHEVSYNVAKAENINRRARYIKIETTQAYAHRWTRINEVEVNGGEYIPGINNPTFKSNLQDTEKGLYEYLVDENITTMFIPSGENGHLTYSLSENNEANHIKVMQNGKAISDATVKGRILNKNRTSEWITLGTLNKGTNEFVLPSGTILLDVKFEWTNKIPNLIELMFSSTTNVTVNKDALKALVNENLDTTTWTTDSKKAYEAALNIGREIIANNYVAQETVDSAVKEIEKAKENKKIKGDISELEELINSSTTDESKYTAKSWANYEKAINAGKKALEDKDNVSVEDVTRLVAEINKAKEGLVFNPASREEAEIALEDIREFINTVGEWDKVYTKNSWDGLLSAKVELEELLELNKTTPQDPTLFEEKKDALLEAKNALVNVTSLIGVIEEFNNIENPSIYTEESYKAYEDAVNEGKKLLINGTVEGVRDAVSAITSAKNNLELAASSESLKNLIGELKKLSKDDYTVNSYKALMDRISEIEGMDLDRMSEEELKKLENELLSLKNALVNVSALRAQIEIAKGFNKDAYTKDSYDALMKVVKEGEKALISGTSEGVSNLVNKIDEKIKALEVRVKDKELQDYINGIKKVDLNKYTEESAKKYKEALEVLKGMAKNTENVSAKDFIEAKENFEKAEANLELKPGTDGDNNNGGNDNNNGGNDNNNGGNGNGGNDNNNGGNGGNDNNNGGNGNGGNNNNNGGNNNGGTGNGGNNGEDVPATGKTENVNIMLFGFLLLTLGGAFIYSKKSKLGKE